MLKNSSLVLVGSGIKFLSHMTIEAKACIEQSDKVLYLVNDPAMKAWIKKNAKQSETLDNLYIKHKRRLDNYREITKYILEATSKYQHVCVVMYGHPCVFAKPGLDAIKQAKSLGCDAKILPGISAEDCLFADLQIDPGEFGCQSFEATDFLVHRRRFDNRSHLILWQVGFIGNLYQLVKNDSLTGLNVLIGYLKNYYDLQHDVKLYEASQYPGINAKIQVVKISQLPELEISNITTLYVPPAEKAEFDAQMLDNLGISINELTM